MKEMPTKKIHSGSFTEEITKYENDIWYSDGEAGILETYDPSLGFLGWLYLPITFRVAIYFRVYIDPDFREWKHIP